MSGPDHGHEADAEENADDPLVTVRYTGTSGALIDGDVTFIRDEPVQIRLPRLERLRAIFRPGADAHTWEEVEG